MKIIRSSQLDYVPASHEDPHNPGVLKKVLAKKTDVADGNIQMINWALLPMGKSFAPHYHEDMEEIFIIISGEVEITIDTETENLSSGDFVIIPARSVHQMTNTGNQNVQYLVIGISASGTGKTINTS